MAIVKPIVTLYLAQTTAALEPAALAFGDATTGKFGTGQFATGGVVELDISDDVQSVSIQRGRNLDSDRPEAGTCTITLRNDRAGTTGYYDPSNVDSPYYPWLDAHTSRIEVGAGAYCVWSGSVARWTMEEAPPTLSVAHVEAVDSIALLSNVNVAVAIPTGSQPSDAIDLLINQAMSQPYTFAPGTFEGTDQGGTVAGNALELIALIERGEGGMFYATTNIYGQASFGFISYVTLVSTASSLTLSDQTSDTIRYSSIQRGPLDARLANDIQVHRYQDTDDTNDVVRADVASIAKYGRRSRTFDVMCENVADLDGFIADTIIAEFKRAVSMVVVTVPTARYDTTGQNSLFAIEPGDWVTVKRTAPGAPATDVDYLVTGITHDFTQSGTATQFVLWPLATIGIGAA